MQLHVEAAAEGQLEAGLHTAILAAGRWGGGASQEQQRGVGSCGEGPVYPFLCLPAKGAGPGPLRGLPA